MKVRIVGWGMAVAAVVMVGSLAWSGETRTMDESGDPPEPTGEKDEAVDIATNPTASCVFSSVAAFTGCMEYYIEWDVEEDEPTGYSADLILEGGEYVGLDLRKPGGAEVDDLCIREFDYDIQWTEVSLPAETPGLVAKIGKFVSYTMPPPGAPKHLPWTPQGGQQVIVYLNDYAYSFTTVASADPGAMDALLYSAISEDWTVISGHDHFIVGSHRDTGETPTRVGLRSYDAGLWFSAVALEPYNTEGSTECDPEPEW